MENNIKMQDRVLARVTAADLTEVVGGPDVLNNNTCQVTGEPQGNINGTDITNADNDCD